MSRIAMFSVQCPVASRKCQALTGTRTETEKKVEETYEHRDGNT